MNFIIKNFSKSLLIFFALLSLLVLSIISTDPQNSTFTNINALKPGANEITIITPKNKTYTEPMSGYYPATYGFENEADGTSRTDIAYVDDTNAIQSDCYVDIINNFPRA